MKCQEEVDFNPIKRRLIFVSVNFESDVLWMLRDVFGINAAHKKFKVSKRTKKD